VRCFCAYAPGITDSRIRDKEVNSSLRMVERNRQQGQSWKWRKELEVVHRRGIQIWPRSQQATNLQKLQDRFQGQTTSLSISIFSTSKNSLGWYIWLRDLRNRGR